VGLLSLGSTCETGEIRQELVKHCLIYSEQVRNSKHKRDTDEIMQDEEAFGTKFNAYLCPNPGSSSNMSSRKQRIIFLEIDRNDPYSVMDVAKVADIVLVVMSCKQTNVSGVKQNPFA